MSLPVLFPLICLFFCFKILSHQKFEWREAFLGSLVTTGTIGIFILEVLDFFHAFNKEMVIFLWGMIVVVLAVGCLYGISSQDPRKVLSKTISFSAMISLIIVLVAFFILTTLLVALLAAPNNLDSQTYHLPRMMHWIQNNSLALYPTNIMRQNYYLPGAEYLLTNLYLLSGNDHFLNCLQWTAYVAVAVVVSRISFYLGASVLGQWMAALAIMSSPMVVLQSTSTQTDLMAGCWIAVSIMFFYSYQLNPYKIKLLLIGFAGGLALLTKVTVGVFLPFFLALFFWSFVQNKKKALIEMGIVLMLAATVMWGWSVRILETHQAVQPRGIFLQEWTPAVVVSNLSKNITSECVVTYEPILKGCEQITNEIHHWIGVLFNAPNVTKSSFKDIFSVHQSLDEDYAGNIWHIMFFVFCAIFVFSKSGLIRWYILCLILAGCMFILSSTWQPWVNRFHVPLIIAAAPLSGVFIDRWRWMGLVLVLFLSIIGTQALFLNVSRPLVGKWNIFNISREGQYFWKIPWMKNQFIGAVRLIKENNCQDVGLRSNENTFEYPLHLFLGPGTRIEHLVSNEALRKIQYPLGSFHPCAVIEQNQDKIFLEIKNFEIKNKVLKTG